MRAERILITGGCGFLGSNLAAGAAREGREVFIFDNLSRPGSIANLNWLRIQYPDAQITCADVRDRDALVKQVRMAKPDAVFHCAGQVAMTRSMENPRLDFETNALGTLNLLEAIRTSGRCPVIIYSSSNKVYGDLDHLTCVETPTRYEYSKFPEGLDETLPLEFRTPYGVSKGSADQMILDAFRSFDLPTIVFRHSSMYGSHQYATEDQGWIGWFCSQVQTQFRNPQHRFTVSGNGKQVRDLLHADDMTRLYLTAADNPQALAGEAFNIGGGPPNALSIIELLTQLGKLMGTVPLAEHIPTRKSDQRVFIANLEKIKRHLGWTPIVTAQEGLSRMLDWTQTITPMDAPRNLSS